MPRLSILSLLLVYITYHTTLFAQGDSQLSPFPTSIEVEVNTQGQIIHFHTVQAKENPYRISKIYGEPIDRLLSHNNLKQNDIISVGSQIKITLENEQIDKSIIAPSSLSTAISYRVKKRESLYHIAKRYFGQSVESLIARNGLSSFVIDPGQLLIVGWLDSKNNRTVANTTETKEEKTVEVEPVQENGITFIKKIVQEKQEVTPLPSATKKADYKILPPLVTKSLRSTRNKSYHFPTNITWLPLDDLKSDLIEIELRTLKSQKRAIGYWNKSGDSEAEFLTFHKTLPINTTVFLKNPLTGIEAQATVVGQLDPNQYADDIDIILTKSLALHLGAHDTLFSLEIYYYE